MTALAPTTRGISCSCRRCKTAWTALVVEGVAPCPACGEVETFILAIIKAPAAVYRPNPPRRAKRVRAPRRRRNSPRGVPVKSFDRREGHLVSKRVLELAYFNVGSVGRDPYVHEFESAGVEMWALKDGSLLIRHPQHRLWEDFVVPDGE